MTIGRSFWIDDDGTGTIGTLIINARLQDIYDNIDAVGYAVKSEANVFTANQEIQKAASRLGIFVPDASQPGIHLYSGGGAGKYILLDPATNQLQVLNGAASAAIFGFDNDGRQVYGKIPFGRLGVILTVQFGIGVFDKTVAHGLGTDAIHIVIANAPRHSLITATTASGITACNSNAFSVDDFYPAAPSAGNINVLLTAEVGYVSNQDVYIFVFLD